MVVGGLQLHVAIIVSGVFPINESNEKNIF